jgi:hypothetical protein
MMDPGRPHGPFGITLGGGSEASLEPEEPGHAAIAQIVKPSPQISIAIRAPRRTSAITPTLSSEFSLGQDIANASIATDRSGAILRTVDDLDAIAPRCAAAYRERRQRGPPLRTSSRFAGRAY